MSLASQSGKKINMKRIVIIDEHPAIRDGLATRISLEDDLEVCGGASDVNDGLELIGEAQPDLAIVDISLKTGNGIDLIKQAKEKYPDVKMLVWSMYDESLYAERAIKAGALGYIDKKNVRDNIIDAIRTVLEGSVYLSAEYSSKVINRLRRGESVEAKLPTEVLTDRELEAYTLIGNGLNTAEIAERMELTVSTVETYRSRIKEKLELRNASQLIREATVWVLSNG